MYGKKQSQETRKKISESKLGHKLLKSAKRKMAKSSGKLNDEQVLEIRHKYESEGMSQPALATLYRDSHLPFLW